MAAHRKPRSDGRSTDTPGGETATSRAATSSPEVVIPLRQEGQTWSPTHCQDVIRTRSTYRVHAWVASVSSALPT